MGELRLHIHIPNFGYSLEVMTMKSLTNTLCAEIESCADELQDCRITSVTIHNATQLTEAEASHIFAVLNHCVDLSYASRCVGVSPELLSTDLMTAFRNFHTDWYRIDFGSLNATEFHALGRAYGMNVIDIVKRMIDSYRMENYAICLTSGMQRQTIRTCSDNLQRVHLFNPGGVTVEPSAQTPADLNKVIAARAYLDDDLAAQGYRRLSISDYVKPEFADLAYTVSDNDGEYWGFGPGAVTLMDGCMVANTPDITTYIDSGGSGEKIITRALRLDPVELTRIDALHRLRSAKGIDWSDFREKHGEGLIAFLESLCERGMATWEDGTVCLTTKGIVLAPQIWNELDRA